MRIGISKSLGGVRVGTSKNVGCVGCGPIVLLFFVLFLLQGCVSSLTSIGKDDSPTDYEAAAHLDDLRAEAAQEEEMEEEVEVEEASDAPCTKYGDTPGFTEDIQGEGPVFAVKNDEFLFLGVKSGSDIYTFGVSDPSGMGMTFALNEEARDATGLGAAAMPGSGADLLRSEMIVSPEHARLIDCLM